MRTVVITVLSLVAFSAGADYINAQAYLILQGQYVEVAGQAIAYDDDGQQRVTRIAGNITVFEEGLYGSPYVVEYVPWIEYGGNWADAVTYTGNCSWRYSGAVVAETSLATTTQYTPWGLTSCSPPPGPSGSPQLCAMQPDGTTMCSPILLGLANGQYALSGLGQGVWFDIDGDGSRERVAWPMRTDEVAFLFMDRNGNDVADDGRELFGTATFLRNGAVGANGFIALAELDSDADQQLTPFDEAWSRLRLWHDRNRDGICRRDEVSTLLANGVELLSLHHWWTGRRDRFGNELRWAASFSRAGARSLYYDAFLLTQR